MRERLARAAYTLLLRLAVPPYFARLWWRGAREAGYRSHWAERLGWGRPGDAGRLWIHAVSLGETRAAAPLIAALREQRPGVRLLLTHGTATGRAAGATLLQPADGQCWLPWDTPGAVRRFLRRQRPALGVLMETEVWPNLVHGAHAAGVPLVLANARLSARSAAKGERYGALLRPALAGIDLVLAQAPADAERLRRGGATRVEVAGNLKYDLVPEPALLDRGRRWRSALARPVVLAANTREGEEAALLRCWCDRAPGIAAGAPRPLLLIVPRHPQRFDAVAALVTAARLTLARRSAWGDEPPGRDASDVWLGDSLGEMPLYYAAADVALLGGSFEALGGHNLIEAAACGCPLIVGPHMFNFAAATELALEAGAVEQVADLDMAVQRALAMVAAPAATERAAWSARALAFAAGHRGAAQRMAGAVLALLR
ncbi:MAG: 3-deoxy-D-manno-octulosonic acid transferase [Burkholderiales bacterium]|nr:3-deoxy-D-manno-octulosonic acid transferase [Burkholderiales bacterium]